MSDPGTTYRTREEVQRMRSTQDPIRGLQRYIEEWGVATDADLKASSDKLSVILYARFDRRLHRLGSR
jgi:TPP-dependent pyruvate/acetoin dehydrogenase alpha subunit